MAEPLPDPFPGWFAALEARHLATLTFPEVRRALQALSGLYVERREKIAAGAAFEGSGKRAAFALYYGPLHFLLVREVVRALGADGAGPRRIVDLGCGTGVGGAAWASCLPARVEVEGIDRNGWAVSEAEWTYRALRVRGRARRGDVSSAVLPRGDGAVLAAFTVNELPDAERETLRERLLAAARAGARVLVIEPLSKRVAPWWPGWAADVVREGGRDDLWRFPAQLPPRLSLLDRAAGLDHRELTGRSLYLSPRPAG